MNRKTLGIVSGAALLLLFVVGTLVYKTEKVEPPAERSARLRENLVRMHSPALGKVDAPVVIVEFFDPACGTCRQFYPFVKQLMAAHPESIRLVLRYAPFHKGSDKVIAVLEAARRQNKFWPALEALLGAQDDWVVNHTAQFERIWKPLEGVGLDLDRVRADMGAPEIAAVIAQDLKDAVALDVTRTPEFFVNGKGLDVFGYDELARLVNEALASSGLSKR